MNIAEIQKHQYYMQLSPQQRQFVTARCEGNGLVEAAKLAWNCKNDASATAMGNRAMRNPNVGWLLSKFYGEVPVPTREELASEVWRRVKGADDSDAAKLIQIAARLLGYEMKAAEQPAAPKPELDGDDEFAI